MSRRPSSAPDPIDLLVGLRLRTRRRARGLSQEALAERLGVSFQQVQKYERGANRVSASRLVRIAVTLDTPLAAFFEGVAELDTLSVERSPVHQALQDMLTEPDGEALAQAFLAIRSRAVRRKLTELACEIAAAEGA